MVWLTPEQIYAGGKRYSIRPLLYDGQPETRMFVEDAVVIVKNDHEQFKHGLADLKGKRLCITGTSPENVQYQALINVLFPLGYMNVAEGNCQDPLVSVAAHFGSSCIPGRWSLLEEKRQRFADLCDRCHKVCTDEDYYASPEGAIKCLLTTGADVAITNSRAALDAELDDSVYQLLCIQGGLKPINQTCAWMNRKPLALVTGNVADTLRAKWRKGLMQAFTRFDGSNYPWIYLLKPTVENAILSDVYHSDTWERYLGLVYLRSMETPFPATVCGKRLHKLEK